MTMQTDVKSMLEECGVSLLDLSRAAGINYTSLSRWMQREDGQTLAERLAPYVYGEKRRELCEAGKKKRRKKK